MQNQRRRYNTIQINLLKLLIMLWKPMTKMTTVIFTTENFTGTYRLYIPVDSSDIKICDPNCPWNMQKVCLAKIKRYNYFFLPERIPKMSKTRILKMEQKNDLIKFLSRKIVSFIIMKYISAYIPIIAFTIWITKNKLPKTFHTSCMMTERLIFLALLVLSNETTIFTQS